jgi:hypothetical protein
MNRNSDKISKVLNKMLEPKKNKAVQTITTDRKEGSRESPNTNSMQDNTKHTVAHISQSDNLAMLINNV